MHIGNKNDKKIEIYNNYLHEISGTKFTLREVDVIACILHNRGEKKIATILEVSNRTIESHTRNIMNKLGYSSREFIIDIIEKSGKLKYLRQYYFYLIINISFEKYLKRIGNTVNRTPINCSIDPCPSTDKGRKLIERISNYLLLAHITLNVEAKNKSAESIYKLYFLNQTNSNFIPDETNIAILCDSSVDKALLTQYEYIDLTSEEGFYLPFFKIIQKIVPHPSIDIIKEEFYNEYKALKDSLHESIPQLAELKKAPEFKTRQIKIISIILLTCCLFFIVIAIIYSKTINYQSQNHTVFSGDYNNNAIIQELFAKQFEELSVSNLTKDESEKNYDIIEKFNPLIEQIILDKSQYSHSILLPSQQLINALFNLNAFASYFLFRQYDFKKTEKLLLYSKKLVEDYLCARGKTNINFDSLTPEEIYTEVAIVNHLAEIYTITLYMLGRAAIYEKNTEKALKYFSISEALGGKTNLFEGILSIRNGVGIAKFDQLKAIIDKGKYEEATIQKSLKELIEIYQDLKSNKNNYIIDYDPSVKKQQYISPAKDTYHIIDCAKRIIKIYLQLIEITKDNNKKSELLTELEQEFIGNQNIPGLLVLAKKNDILDRIKSDIYNLLGNTLLAFLGTESDFKSLKDNITQELKISWQNDLELIEKVFIVAKSNSRSNEHTKLEAHKGLSKVYKAMLKQPDINQAKKEKISLKLADSRNFVNKNKK